MPCTPTRFLHIPAIFTNSNVMSIHALFEEQARNHANETAVVCGERQVSYSDLDRRSNELAHLLRSYGVGPEVVVGVGAARSIEMLVAILGIVKAGGAYMPLDPSYPLERLRLMISRTNTPLVLTTHPAPSLEALGVEILDLASQDSLIRSRSESPASCVVNDHNLLCVMYTSGSSGLPKGVGVTHSGVVRLVKDVSYVDISPSDVFLQLAPTTFDASTFEIWAPLLNGARLALYPHASVNVGQLKKTIRTHGVTVLWLSAGLFHRMVDDAIDIFRPIKQLIAGGDQLSAARVRRLLETVPSCRIINGYGPTEGTTFTTCHRMTCRADVDMIVPIGTPLRRTLIHVLNEHLQKVPEGAVGELYICGDGLARGYINSPDLTAERFVANPFVADGGRMYRTGDLVRQTSSGTLVFLGRIDRQLKVRGYRIEPGEVEAALAAHPRVHDAVVVALKEGLDDERLVAYFVPSGSPGPSSAELRAHLEKSVPTYMIPSECIAVDRLSLTENGKVNRADLARLE